MKTYTNKDIIDRIDFTFLISIIIALTGAWFFIYNLVVEMTADDKFETIFGVSVCHYILTLYVIISLYIAFKKGNNIVSEYSMNRHGGHFFEELVVFFMNSWIYALMFVLFTIIYFYILPLKDVVFFIYIFVAIIFVIFLAYALFRKYYSKRIVAYISTLLCSGFVFTGFFVFIFLISTLAMRIDYQTDKEVYNKEDIATLTVHCQGYMLTPNYEVKSLNNYRHDNLSCCMVFPVSEVKSWYVKGRCFKLEYSYNYMGLFRVTKYKYIPIYVRPDRY